MDDLELMISKEEKEKNIKTLKENLMRMGIIEPCKLNRMLNSVIEVCSEWDIDNNLPKLSICETQLVEKSLDRKKLLCVELQEIQSEIQRLNARYLLVKQEISNINNNVCGIQGHRLSNEIKLDDDVNSNTYIVDSYEYRKCFVCGKEVLENNLRKKDVVIKMKRRSEIN